MCPIRSSASIRSVENRDQVRSGQVRLGDDFIGPAVGQMVQCRLRLSQNNQFSRRKSDHRVWFGLTSIFPGRSGQLETEDEEDEEEAGGELVRRTRTRRRTMSSEDDEEEQKMDEEWEKGGGNCNRKFLCPLKLWLKVPQIAINHCPGSKWARWRPNNGSGQRIR